MVKSPTLNEQYWSTVITALLQVVLGHQRLLPIRNTANICLGVGYRTVNADVALASILILMSLDQPTYGEF